MTEEEVVHALHYQANIQPSFTKLVWKKLEEQNPEFFKAYNLKLLIKEQITAFNFLVSQQAQIMQQRGQPYFSSVNAPGPSMPVGNVQPSENMNVPPSSLSDDINSSDPSFSSKEASSPSSYLNDNSELTDPNIFLDTGNM